MAIIAITMFIGTTVLAHAFRVMPTAAESGVSQLARAIFGGGTAGYYGRADCHDAESWFWLPTPPCGFPAPVVYRRSRRVLPRQFMNQGIVSRFSNGIIVCRSSRGS